MKKYKVIKTDDFYRSVNEIHDYLFGKSQSLQVATEFVERLVYFPDYSFEYAPKRGTEIQKNGRIFRRISFKDSSEYYYIIEIDELENTVYVINIFHAKQSERNTLDTL